MINETENRFIAYEYKQFKTESRRASFYIDGYANFGWELDHNVMTASKETESARVVPGSQTRITIQLKRDRRILNKAELTRLQRNFEACAAEIDALEKAKTTAATIASLTLGIIGTAFMAGVTFAVTAEPMHVLLCVVLAIPGFLCWILPFFVYKKIRRKQTEKMESLIEAKYDEIYELCEKGSKLLY